MSKLASIVLTADRKVAKGMKIGIIPLFSNTEGWKNFELLENVEKGKTKINVTIAKFGSFQTKANATKRKGEKVALWLLLNSSDFSKKIAATNDIAQGDELTVTLEAL